MTTAFQSNAFQNNAFQIDAVVVVASTALDSGGGASKRRSRARTINFEEMYEHIDALNARNQKERKDALRRLDQTIEDLVNGVKEEAKEVASPVPANVTKTAGVISQKIATALVGKARNLDFAALQQSIRQFEQQIRAAQQRFEAHDRRIAIEKELARQRGNLIAAEQQMARERELERLRALEEDDEEVIMFLM